MNIPISNILYICFSHKYEKKSKKKKKYNFDNYLKN